MKELVLLLNSYVHMKYHLTIQEKIGSTKVRNICFIFSEAISV
jgi:hypothetical protein